MFAIGDYVIFTQDGARGVVLGVKDGRCQVLWEDYFVSWEKQELLISDNFVNVFRMNRSTGHAAFAPGPTGKWQES